MTVMKHRRSMRDCGAHDSGAQLSCGEPRNASEPKKCAHQAGEKLKDGHTGNSIHMCIKA